MKEERPNIDQTCLDIEKLAEDLRSKEKEYKEGVLQQNLVILRSTLVLDSEDESDVIVLLKTYQNTKINFQNMTYDVTITSLLKTMAKFGPP